MSGTDLRELVAQAGANDLVYEDPLLPGRPVLLRAARPRLYTARTPLLFVHHGDLRNGDDFRNYWQPFVDEAEILVVVPEFSESAYPGSEWYSSGNRIDADGRVNPRGTWTYGVPGRLYTALCRQGVTSRQSYGSFGHSSGGQFVHRMISLGFRDGVAVAATANAGTYAMPNLDIAFPYGLGGTQIDDAALRALLMFPLTVFAGTADIDTTSVHFPSDDAAMRQGPTRYARAHNYVAAARQAAKQRGISCRWTIVDVADVGHDGQKMSLAAAMVLAAALRAAEP